MYAELRRHGHRVARCTVERLMLTHGLRGLRRGGMPVTIVASSASDVRPDLGDRNFPATAPHQLWVADNTYIRTFAGWTYAAFIFNVFSRMVVGWQVSISMRTNLALDALKMCIWNRTREGSDLNGLTHHSDRGVQYVALCYSERLADAAAVASVGSRGDSYDNSMAEAFNWLLKGELIHKDGPWKGLDDVEYAPADYVDWNNHGDFTARSA